MWLSGRRRPPGAEGVHCQDADARWRQANGMLRQEPKIQQYIAQPSRPQDALRVTDYMDTLLMSCRRKRAKKG